MMDIYSVVILLLLVAVNCTADMTKSKCDQMAELTQDYIPLLKTNLQKANKRAKDAEAALNLERTRSTNLKNELSLNSKRCNEIAKQLKRQTSQNDTNCGTQQQLASLNTSNSTTNGTEQCRQLFKELQEARQQLELVPILQMKLENETQQCFSEQNDTESKEQTIQQLTSDLSAANERSQHLENQLFNARNSSRSGRLSEINALKQQVRRLQAELSTTKQNNDKLTKRLEESQTHPDLSGELNNDLENERQERLKAESELRAQRQEQFKLRAQVAALNSRLKRTQAELNRTRIRNDELSKLVDESKSQIPLITELRVELEYERQERFKAENLSKAEMQKLMNSEAALNIATRKLFRAEQEVSAERQERRKCENISYALRQDVVQLQSRNAAPKSENQCANATALASQCTHEINMLKGQISPTQHLLTAMLKELGSSTNNVPSNEMCDSSGYWLWHLERGRVVDVDTTDFADRSVHEEFIRLKQGHYGWISWPHILLPASLGGVKMSAHFGKQKNHNNMMLWFGVHGDEYNFKTINVKLPLTLQVRAWIIDPETKAHIGPLLTDKITWRDFRSGSIFPVTNDVFRLARPPVILVRFSTA